MSKNFTKEPIFEAHLSAQILAGQILNLIEADKNLKAAKGRIPEYTGQWSGEDYIKDELEEWHQAAQCVYNTIHCK